MNINDLTDWLLFFQDDDTIFNINSVKNCGIANFFLLSRQNAILIGEKLAQQHNQNSIKFQ